MLLRDSCCRVRRQRAFTLIELLIVIAIIAILIAILFPVLGSMSEGAKTVKCANNMRQLAAAMSAYGTDNEGRFPPNPSGGGSSTVAGESVKAWVFGSTAIGETGRQAILNGSLFKYSQNEGLYLCPSYPNQSTDPAKHFFRSYSMCDYISGDDSAPGTNNENPNVANFNRKDTEIDRILNIIGTTPNKPRAQRYSSVPRASIVMMFGEENPYNYPPPDHSAFINDAYYRRATGNDRSATFHGDLPPNSGTGKANIIFVDGHGAAVTRDQADAAYLSYYLP